MLALAFWEDRSKDPVVKYTPGDEIPDDHPKRDWLLRSKIAVVPESVEPVEDVADEVVDAPDDDAPETVADPEPVKVDAAKPKPTDSIDDHRAYLKARDIDTKGLSRAQMVKLIAGLED